MRKLIILFSALFVFNLFANCCACSKEYKAGVKECNAYAKLCMSTCKQSTTLKKLLKCQRNCLLRFNKCQITNHDNYSDCMIMNYGKVQTVVYY